MTNPSIPDTPTNALDLPPVARAANPYEPPPHGRHRLGSRDHEVHAVAIDGVVLRPKKPSPLVRETTGRYNGPVPS